MVGRVHQLDQEILAYNKSKPADKDFLPTFESSVRAAGISPGSMIAVEPLANVFEIAVLRPGDTAYRVPGTLAPGRIWFDPNGVACR